MLGIHNYNSKVTDDEYYWEKILNIIELALLENSHLTVKSKHEWFKIKATNAEGKITNFVADAILFHAPGEHHINEKAYSMEM